MLLTLPLSYPDPVVLSAPAPCIQVWERSTGTIIHSAEFSSLKGVKNDIGTAVMTVRDFAPGTELLVDGDGFYLKGPLSKTLVVAYDGQVIGDYYVDGPKSSPSAGLTTLNLKDSTGHTSELELGPVGATDMLGPMSTWLDVGVISTGADSPGAGGGVSIRPDPALKTGSDRYKEQTADFGAALVDRKVYFAIWAKVPVAVPVKDLPGHALQVTTYDRDAPGTTPSPTGPVPGKVATTQYVDIDASLPRDTWQRLTATIDIPAGHHYDGRFAGWACTGAGNEIIYADPWLVIDLGIGVPPGATTGDLGMMLWQYGLDFSGVGGFSALTAETGTFFPTGYRLEKNDHPNIYQEITNLSDLEWHWDPATHSVISGPLRSTGRLHRDLTLGTDGRDADTTDWSGSTGSSAQQPNGMATLAVVATADSDPAREESGVSAGAPHDWWTYRQADAGVLPDALAGMAEADLAAGSDNTIIDHETHLNTPPGGRCPGDWLLPRGSNPPLGLCDLVPGRIVQGFADMSKLWQVASWELLPQQGFDLTVVWE